MKIRVATIFYNDKSDETTIKFCDDFSKWEPLLRADILKDAAILTEDAYETSLSDLKDDWEERRAKWLEKTSANQ